MSFNKILLVKLPYKDSYYQYIDLPAALGILSEALSYHGMDHEVYDLQANKSLENFYSVIESYKPAFIGFSMMTFRYLDNYQIINSVKQRYPDIKIIVGGPHASTFREKIFEECQGIDIVVLLEGEDILVDICKGKSLKEVRGIIYRENNEIISTGQRDYILDLDKYPFPRYSKFNIRNYEIIPVVTSRGCPFACIYCPIKTTVGKKWRKRSAEKIVEEFEYWANSGFEVLQIEDDNFTFNRERVVEICKKIKERGLEKKIRITLTNGVRADRVDYELLKIMRESGFSAVAFGVESGNDRVLKILNKGEKLQVIEDAIKIACNLDFEVYLFFVIGAPGETESDVYDSIRLAKKYPVVESAFYHLIPFPGSKLYKWVEENNKFLFKAPDYLNHASHWVNQPLFVTDELSENKRKDLYSLANKEGRKHAQKTLNRKLAQKISKRFNIPTMLTYPVVSLGRKDFIKKIIKKTPVWERIKQIKYADQ